MTYREFVVPDEAELLDVLGVEPEPIEGETAAWLPRFIAADRLLFGHDVLARAITIRWSRNGVMLLDLAHDGAV